MSSNRRTPPRVIDVPSRGRGSRGSGHTGGGSSRGSGSGVRGGAYPRLQGRATMPTDSTPRTLLSTLLDGQQSLRARIYAVSSLRKGLSKPAFRGEVLPLLPPLWRSLCELAWGSRATTPELSIVVGKLLGELGIALAHEPSVSLSGTAGLLYEWALSATQALAGSPAVHRQRAGLLAIATSLQGAPDALLGRYASACLNVCIGLLEHEETDPVLLEDIFAVVKEAAQRTISVRAHFRNLVDLLLGWGLDPICPASARPGLFGALDAYHDCWFSSESWSAKLMVSLARDQGWTHDAPSFLARFSCTLPLLRALSTLPHHRRLVVQACTEKLLVAETVFQKERKNTWTVDDVEMRLELVGLLSKAVPLLAARPLQNARDSLVSTPLDSEDDVAFVSSERFSQILSLVPIGATEIGKKATDAVNCPRSDDWRMIEAIKTTRIKIAWSVKMDQTGSQNAFATVLVRLLIRLLLQSLPCSKEASSNLADQLHTVLIDCLAACGSDLPLANIAPDLASLWLQWDKSDKKMECLTDRFFVRQPLVTLLVVEGLLADIEAGRACTRDSSVMKQLCDLVCQEFAEGTVQNIEIVSVVFTSVCAVLLSKGNGLPPGSKDEDIELGLVEMLVAAGRALQSYSDYFFAKKSDALHSDVPLGFLQAGLIRSFLPKAGGLLDDVSKRKPLTRLLVWVQESGQHGDASYSTSKESTQLLSNITHCMVSALKSNGAFEMLDAALTAFLRMCQLHSTAWDDPETSRTLVLAWYSASAAQSHVDTGVRRAAIQLLSCPSFLLGLSLVSSSDADRYLTDSQDDLFAGFIFGQKGGLAMDARTNTLFLSFLLGTPAPASASGAVVVAPKSGLRFSRPGAAVSQAPFGVPPLGFDRLLLRVLRSRCEAVCCDSMLVRESVASLVRELCSSGLRTFVGATSDLLSAFELAIQNISNSLATRRESLAYVQNGDSGSSSGATPREQEVQKLHCRGLLLLEAMYTLERVCRQRGEAASLGGHARSNSTHRSAIEGTTIPSQQFLNEESVRVEVLSWLTHVRPSLLRLARLLRADGHTAFHGQKLLLELLVEQRKKKKKKKGGTHSKSESKQEVVDPPPKDEGKGEEIERVRTKSSGPAILSRSRPSKPGSSLQPKRMILLRRAPSPSIVPQDTRAPSPHHPGPASVAKNDPAATSTSDKLSLLLDSLARTAVRQRDPDLISGIAAQVDGLVSNEPSCVMWMGAAKAHASERYDLAVKRYRLALQEGAEPATAHPGSSSGAAVPFRQHTQEEPHLRSTILELTCQAYAAMGNPSSMDQLLNEMEGGAVSEEGKVPVSRLTACRDLANWKSSAFVPEEEENKQYMSHQVQVAGLELLVQSNVSERELSQMRAPNVERLLLRGLPSLVLPPSEELAAMGAILLMSRQNPQRQSSTLSVPSSFVQAPLDALVTLLVLNRATQPATEQIQLQMLAVAQRAVETSNPTIARRLLDGLSEDLPPLLCLRRGVIDLQLTPAEVIIPSSKPAMAWPGLAPYFEACRGSQSLEALTEALVPVASRLLDEPDAREVILAALKEEASSYISYDEAMFGLMEFRSDEANSHLWWSYACWLLDSTSNCTLEPEQLNSEALDALCAAVRAGMDSPSRVRAAILRCISLLEKVKIAGPIGDNRADEMILRACLSVPRAAWIPSLRALCTLPEAADPIVIELLRYVAQEGPQQVAVALHSLGTEGTRLASQTWPDAAEPTSSLLQETNQWLDQLESSAVLWEERVYSVVAEFAGAITKAMKRRGQLSPDTLPCLALLFREAMRGLLTGCAVNSNVMCGINSETETVSRQKSCELILEAVRTLDGSLIAGLRSRQMSSDSKEQQHQLVATLGAARKLAVVAARKIAGLLPAGHLSLQEVLRHGPVHNRHHHMANDPSRKTEVLADQYEQFRVLTHRVAFPMPGQLHSGGTRVVSLVPTLRLLQTKTRPKIIALVGDDGVERRFLLKGKEDVGLHSGLLSVLSLSVSAAAESDPRLRDAAGLYTMIPVGATTAMIEWVEGASSFFELHNAASVKRRGRETVLPATMPVDAPRPVDLFRRAIRAVGIDPGKVPRKSWPQPLMLEAFRHLQRGAPQEFLADALLAASPTPDIWWACHKRFAQSSAIMSMCGWVYGIGDRHLDNILLDCRSGKCWHIDFDVLFDRGQLLAVPERVPFRLTRCMLWALGPVGAAGPFGDACRSTLTGLREQRSQLLACLAQELTHAADDSLQQLDFTRPSSGEKASVWEERLTLELCLARLTTFLRASASDEWQSALSESASLAQEALHVLVPLVSSLESSKSDIKDALKQLLEKIITTAEFERRLKSKSIAGRELAKARQTLEEAVTRARGALDNAQGLVQEWATARAQAERAIVTLRVQGPEDALISALNAVDISFAPSSVSLRGLNGVDWSKSSPVSCAAASSDTELVDLLAHRAHATLALADGLSQLRRYLDEQQGVALEGTVLAADSPDILEKAAEALTGLLGEANNQEGVEGSRSGIERHRKEVQTVVQELRLLLVQHATPTILKRPEDESNGTDVLQQQDGTTSSGGLHEKYSTMLETAMEERQHDAAQEACDVAISSLRRACLELCAHNQLNTLFRGLVSHLSGLASNLTASQDKLDFDAAIRGAQQCVLGWASMAVVVQESTPESVDIFATGKLAWVSEAVQALDGIAMGLAELRLALSAGGLNPDVETALERMLADIWRLSSVEEPSRPSVQAFLQTHPVDGHMREQLEEALKNAFETVFVRALKSLLLASMSAFGAAAGVDDLGWNDSNNPQEQTLGAAAVSKMSSPLVPELVPFVDFDPNLEGPGMALEDESTSLVGSSLEPADEEADMNAWVRTADEEWPEISMEDEEDNTTTSIGEEEDGWSDIIEGSDLVLPHEATAREERSPLQISKKTDATKAMDFTAVLGRYQQLLGRAAELDATAHICRLMVSATSQTNGSAQQNDSQRGAPLSSRPPADLLEELASRLQVVGDAERSLHAWAARDAMVQKDLVGACALPAYRPHLQAALRQRQRWLRNASAASGMLATLTGTLLNLWPLSQDKEGYNSAFSDLSALQARTIEACRGCLDALNALQVANQKRYAAAEQLDSAEARVAEVKMTKTRRDDAARSLRRHVPELIRRVSQALRRLPGVTAELASSSPEENNNTTTSSRETTKRLHDVLESARTLLDGNRRHPDAVLLEENNEETDPAILLLDAIRELDCLAGLPDLLAHQVNPWLQDMQTVLKMAQHGPTIAADCAARISALLGHPCLDQLVSVVNTLGCEKDNNVLDRIGIATDAAWSGLLLVQAQKNFGSLVPEHLREDVVQLVDGSCPLVPLANQLSGSETAPSLTGPLPATLFPTVPLSRGEREAVIGSVLAHLRHKLSDELPVRTRVASLVKQATDSHTLATMFEGWMPWV